MGTELAAQHGRSPTALAIGNSGIVNRVEALKNIDIDALRSEWKRVFRSPPPKRISRSLLELGIAWKIQEAAAGGLSRKAQRRLDQMVEEIESIGTVEASRTVGVKPGSHLVREWRGATHDVMVLEDGFEWKGRIWRSLSEIAREITGTRWSGPRFFGLEKPRPGRGGGAHV